MKKHNPFEQQLAGLDDAPVVPRMMEVEKIYEGNPNALFRKRSLEDLLKAEEFDEEKLLKMIESWNKHEEETKGFGPIFCC